MNDDVDELRAALSADATRVLDRVWQTYYQSKGSAWPAVQDVQVDFNKPTVLAVLEELRSGVVFDENDRYQMGLLGVLLSTDGPDAEKLVDGYLGFMCKSVREARSKGQTLEVIQSRDVAAAFHLDDRELSILASTLQLGRLGGDRGAGGGPIWAAGIPRELPDMILLKDFRPFLRKRAVRMADELAAARGPVGPRQSTFWFIAEPVLRSSLEADFAELSRLQTIVAHKSSIVLSGGILEAMLLDVLSREEDRAKAANRSRKNPTSRELDRWDLFDLVEVGGELQVIPASTIHLSQALREFRNLVHPGKHLREQVTLTQDEAFIAVKTVEICIRAIATYESKKARLPGKRKGQ